MKIKKYTAIFMIMLLSVQLGMLFLIVKKDQVMAEGTGVNTTISVASGTIKSRQEVNLHVNVFGSAGDFLGEHGKIIVTIPREIVYNVNDFDTKMLIPEPFKYEGIERDTTNFKLTFSVDTKLIGENDAFNGLFQIKFGAPILKVGGAQASIQNFTVTYAGKQQQTSAEIQRQNTLHLPVFDKWYKGDFDQNGVANLNTMAPEGNRFQLVVNYRGVELKDVVVSDTLPQGTKLIPAVSRVSTPGNPMTKDNIRILKVTDFDEEGEAIRYAYVTEEFKDKIAYNDVTKRFTVDFGDIAADTTYFVEYALEIEDTNLGIKANVANLTASNRQPIEKTVSVQAIKHYGTSYILNKSVDKTALNYDENELTYTLRLVPLDGDAIPAGTVVTDPLSEKMVAPEIGAYDEKKFDIKVENNKLVIKMLQDLPKGDLAEWHFKVNVASLKMGEMLSNQAFLILPNDMIYSNSVSTRKYDGRIQIKKVDNLNNPVSGAMYEILNDKDERVFEGITNAKGLLVSNALQLGNYTVREVLAPVGYILDNTPHYVVVNDGDTVPIILGTENMLRSGTIELTKVDADNPSMTLADAIFELRDNEGEILLQDMTTDINGKIVISGLIPGKYSFIETKAPAGYILDNTPVLVTVEIGENDTQVQVIKENRREVSVAPEKPPVLLDPPDRIPEITLPETPVTTPVKKLMKIPVNPVIKPITNTVEKTTPPQIKLPKTGDSLANQAVFYGLGMLLLGVVYLVRRKSA
ncbi:SpaA isopeptide-forming pilin-related protein [Paenilisteria newyorkensis]|uniref:SpaA isopeptide-forming pilin-related protein n=1 Tax=Listeria newyorkensis TaxID=1497681 RepID=UPI00066A0CBB|nr:SpaA isopeptide-forming pilin-related protein [Listeria newyorkensis]KMT62300.1 collagen adhesion protein [Listeria newyorkensis]